MWFLNIENFFLSTFEVNTKKSNLVTGKFLNILCHNSISCDGIPWGSFNVILINSLSYTSILQGSIEQLQNIPCCMIFYNQIWPKNKRHSIYTSRLFVPFEAHSLFFSWCWSLCNSSLLKETQGKNSFRLYAIWIMFTNAEQQYLNPVCFIKLFIYL